MQPVMSVADVREFEQALAEKGTPDSELMRRAGAVVAMQAAHLVRGGSVVVLCGMGNNGGDGWVAADNLARHGYEVAVVCAATPAVMNSELARRVALRTAEMGVPVHVDPSVEQLEELLLPADVVIDACFGTGFSGELPEPYVTWARVVDEVCAGQVVSVDVPSGIDATTGMAAGEYFSADVTVTMFAAKPGLVSGVGRQASGKVVVASLVGDEQGLQDISDAAAAFVLDERDYLDVLPEPDPLQDKYTRGRVLVVAGSTRYPGAAIMAALAAARSGAGYVTLAVPAPVVSVAQAHLLSIPVVGLPVDPEGSFAVEAAEHVERLLEHVDAVLAGPGMTTSLGACEVVRALLRSEVGLVLDADALNAVVRICAGSAEAHPQALRREAPLVLTPHRRELARLMGGELERTQSLAGAMGAAQALAWAVGSSDFCVIAKGPVSCVSTIDSTLVPQPGPIALATAGTGDVLAGIVVGMLAQSMAALAQDERLDSSDLLMMMAGADRVHAIAGELACRAHGSRGVIATDVADAVGRAVDELLRRSERDYETAGEDPGSVLEDDLAFEDESRIRPAGEAGAQGGAGHAPAQDKAGEPETPAAEAMPQVDLSDLSIDTLEEPQDAEAHPGARAQEQEQAQAEARSAAAQSGAAEEAPAAQPPAAQGQEGPEAQVPQPGGSEATGVADASDAPDAEGRPGAQDADASRLAAEGRPTPGQQLPPFLANLMTADALAEAPGAQEGGAQALAEGDRPSADLTQVMPAIGEQAPGAQAPEAQAPAPAKAPARKLSPLELFHEKASQHTGEKQVTPPEERPSASRKSKQKGKGKSKADRPQK